MAGHSKWANIKHKKAAADKKRGKIFTRLSKEIMLAAKIGGSDPEANARLRTAINSAKQANVPNDNIERAIKKGAGELDDAVLEELTYEGYGPGGIAIIVDCLTDNRNRTAADIRHLFSKGNGNLASTGSVSWSFQPKSRFLIEGDAANEDKLMETFFADDVDVENIHVDDEQAEVIAPIESFDAVVSCLEKAGITPAESGLTRIPDNLTEVEDLQTAKQVLDLIESLDDYDDTQNTYSNADISDKLLEQLSDD